MEKRKNPYIIPCVGGWILTIICLYQSFAQIGRFDGSSDAYMTATVILAVVSFVLFFLAMRRSGSNLRSTANEKASVLDTWLSDNGYNPEKSITYHQYLDKITVMADPVKKVLLLAQVKEKEPFSAPIVIPFQNILDCNFMEDGTATGQIGRAVTGGLLAGTAGAVVGAATAKNRSISRVQLSIQTTDIVTPRVTLDLIHLPIQTDTQAYLDLMDFKEELTATITAIVAQNQSAAKES